MQTPDWYAGWRHEALHELIAKNACLKDEFRLGSWPRYHHDLHLGRLVFLENDIVKVIAEIQIVGSTSTKAGNWLWAWANSHWPSAYVSDSNLVRAYGAEHGIAELTCDYVEDDDLNDLGWGLTGVTARICNGVGAYRPPSDDGTRLYLIFKSVTWAV